MKLRTLLPLALLLHCGVVATHAHPTNPNQSIRATTIAIADVTDHELRLTLEVGADDLAVFRELTIDGPRPMPSPAQETFFQKRMVIDADGDLLTGRVARVEKRHRIVRDAVTGEPLPPGTTPGEPVTLIELRYPLAGRPKALHFNPPHGPDFRPATVGLVVNHRAIPVNDFDFLKTPVNLRLDWADPWKSQFRGLRLQRYYNSPVWATLSVEPREMRLEIVYREAVLANAMKPHNGTIAEWLRSQVAITIDGRPVQPAAEPVGVLRQSLSKIERVADGATVPPEARLSVLTLTHTCDTSPREVVVRWPVFGTGLESVPMWVNTGPIPVKLTSSAPSFHWKENVQPDNSVIVPKPTSWTGRVTRVLILFGLIVVSLWLVIGFAPFAAISLGARGSLAFTVVSLTIGFLTWLPRQFQPHEQDFLNDQQVERILQTVLSKSYKAFDCRQEEAVYDTLAQSVTEDLLRDAYLSIRRSIDSPDKVGRARVRSVSIQSCEKTAEEVDGLRAKCRWTAEVAITHFGHTHLRTIQYLANLTLKPHAGRWKLAKIDLLEENELPAPGPGGVSSP